MIRGPLGLLLPLSTMFSRLIRVLACVSMALLSVADEHSAVGMGHLCSSVDGARLLLDVVRRPHLGRCQGSLVQTSVVKTDEQPRWGPGKAARPLAGV